MNCNQSLGKEAVMRRNKRTKETESVAVTLQRYTHTLLDAAVCVFVLLILVAMPFYNQEGYAHIGTDKSSFFYKVSAGAGRIAVPLLILYLTFSLTVFLQNGGTASRLRTCLKEKITLTDLFAGAYGISLLLSYSFSRYKADALWGATGWYMGLYLQLALVGIYFFVSKCWKPRRWIFFTILPVSAIVFLLEYLNRFHIDPLRMQQYGTEFISTIGNINWYCGYQVSVFFAGTALFWQGTSIRTWQKVLLMTYTLLGFASLITQGSNSGIVAMAVVLLTMFCLSAPDSDRMYRFWQVMLLLGGACLLTYGIQSVTGRTINYKDISIEILTSREISIFMTIMSLLMLGVTAVCRKRNCYPQKIGRILANICVGTIVTFVLVYVIVLTVNTLYPGRIGPLSQNQWFVFSDTWGSFRGATWKAGVLCFWEQDFLHKLVGVGPDAMASYLYYAGSSRLLEIVTEAFPALRLTNAHNEWLTVLVNTGVLGCISFVGMITSARVRFLRRKGGNVIPYACGFCLLGYTANNMFSFQQSVNTATIFVILGIGEAFSQKYGTEEINMV